MTTLNFIWILAATALLGGGLGAALSHIPGRRGGTLLSGLLLAPVSAALFAGGLCLLSRSTEPAVVLDKVFPDRLSRLAGCGLLLLLACGLGLFFGAIRAKGLRRYFRAVQDSRLHKGLGLALLGGGAALALGCALLAGDPPPTPIRLTEVCCANYQRADPDTGKYSDYVELCNTSDETVNIGGYFLSDNGKKRGRFRLPELSLEPGACVLLWADGTGTSGQWGGEAIHLNFSLKEGETLWFSSPFGVLLERVTIPAPHKDVSMSLVDGEWILAWGTPGRSNETAKPYTPPSLDPPVFSLAGGFYDEPQTLTLTAAPGCEIHYTLNATLPSESSPLYEGPLTLIDCSDQPNRVWNQVNTTPDRSAVVTEPVDKGMVVRAAAYGPDGAYSETVTAVYFIGETFAKYRDRSVLSLVVNPGDLFGKYGIMVTGPAYDEWLEGGKVGDTPDMNLYRHGRGWERDTQLSLWDEDGTLVLDTACGIRLQGNAARAQRYKRFALYSRPLYSGSSVFSVQLFSGVDSHSVSTREDAYDFVVHQLLEDRDLGTLDALPVQLFLNGEFYYSSYLRERYDKQWFQSHYGVKEKELVLISDNELDYGTEADYADYEALMDYIQTHDCADPAVWAEIQRQIDVQSLLDYLAANFYCNNIDWRFQKNYKLWRVRSARGDGVLDGRWRWLAYDMDAVGWASMRIEEPLASIDPFHALLPWLSGLDNQTIYLDMPLFSDLLKNPEFKTRFIQTYLDLMNVNFDLDYAMPVLEEFGLTEHWLWTDFLTERPPYALENLRQAMELEGEACTLTLRLSDAAGGSVRLNTTQPDCSGEAWSGTWLTGVPLTLSAEAAPGWRFVGWRGDAEGAENELLLTPTGDLAVTAVFEKR